MTFRTAHLGWIPAIAAISLATTAASAGEEAQPEHFAGLHAAALVHWSYDERFSPLAYRGASFGGALSYEFRGEENHHMAGARFGIGPTTGGFDERMTYVDEEGVARTLTVDRTQIQAALNYAYHRALARSPRGRTRLYLGALADAYVYLVSSLSFNWLAAYSLNASAQLTADPAPRHFVAVRFYVPLLTYLCRPPWSIYDDSVMDVPEWKNAFSGHLTSLNEYVRLTAELRYEYAIDRRWRLSFSYELSYFYTDDPTPFYAVANSFLVGATPGFGGGR
jgi:hypothetical protein